MGELHPHKRLGWDDKAWAALIESIKKIEDAWHQCLEPDVRQIVPVDRGDPSWAEFVVLLIAADQRCRSAVDRAKPFDAYLAEWPELAADPKDRSRLREALRTSSGNSAATPATRTFIPERSLRPALGTLLPAGARLGHYEIERVLGQGGMGIVYLARDLELDHPVAIKFPRVDRLSPERIARFFDEAKTLLKLLYPGIVQLHHVDRDPQGTPYVVMEYIEGVSLQQLIQAGSLPHVRSAKVVAQAARAILHAHRQGVVHRDLKPANILIDLKGNPRIADFGLAIDERQQGGKAGDRSGTLAYMAPEQVRGEANYLDGRTDIWALGVIFYELLTGRRPFNGQDCEELEQEILERNPKPPREIDASIPEDFERVCLACLEKSPADRPLSAEYVARELERLVAPRSHAKRLAAELRAGSFGCAFTVTVATLLIAVFLVPPVWNWFRGIERVAHLSIDDEVPAESQREDIVAAKERDKRNNAIKAKMSKEDLDPQAEAKAEPRSEPRYPPFPAEPKAEPRSYDCPAPMEAPNVEPKESLPQEPTRTKRRRQPEFYFFTDEPTVKKNWQIVGTWRINGEGLRLSNGGSSIRSERKLKGNVSIQIMYTLADYCELDVRMFGESMRLRGGGLHIVYIMRKGDTIFFATDKQSPLWVKIKEERLDDESDLAIFLQSRFSTDQEVLVRSVVILEE